MSSASKRIAMHKRKTSTSRVAGYSIPGDRFKVLPEWSAAPDPLQPNPCWRP
jgi:hypothetical protein